METLIPIIKYTFVIAVGVEVVLMVRALVMLALGKARAAGPTIPSVEE